MNSIDVYWSYAESQKEYDCNLSNSNSFYNVETPEKLFGALDKRLIRSDFSKCPAIRDNLKNTYVIRCPIDISIRFNIEEQSILYKNVNEHQWSTMNDIKDIGNNIIQLMFPYTFFSDTELIVQQLPPYYHYNESYLNKCAIATGEYDISKWFRSLSLALIPHSNEDQIDIKQGDVLYYIRFNTSKKINLKKFYPSEDLINISNNIKLSTHADKSFKFKPLSLYYNTFKKSKIKNKIIKEIKNNLL